MHSLSKAKGIGLVSMFLITAQASPMPGALHQLSSRAISGYQGCTDAQKTRLNKGFSDAATLARFASDHADMGLTDTWAWKHYFRTDDDGKQEDLDNAQKYWNGVLINTTPTNAPYSFGVSCDKEDDPGCKGGKTVAFTDPEPQDGDTPRLIHICPLFFKDGVKETSKDLDTYKFEKSTRSKTTWCSPGNNFGWYEVAGHTLLHEMTHLDALGEYAGLPLRKGSDGIESHGTEDSNDFTGLYPVVARALASAWQADPQGYGGTPTYRNAENIAGAALEYYMLALCKSEANVDIEEIPL